jgi:1,4-alpha-glucan branching enzyme
VKATTRKEKARMVDFSFSAPHAEGISIAGDFNDWNSTSHPMKREKRDKEGVWKASLNLAPGTYQYRFFVDGEWQTHPTCTDCVENPFGTLNSLKKVA